MSKKEQLSAKNALLLRCSKAQPGSKNKLRA